MDKLLDCVVIGGGPAGLSASINLVNRNKDILLLSLSTNYLKKAQRVDNYLGFYNISGTDLMNKFLEHAEKMNVNIKYGRVLNIYKFEDYFMINFQNEIIKTKSIILALGIVKNVLIENEDSFLGKGVSYCATCDGMLYKNKTVAITGNSSDIVNEANFLKSIGCKVYFVSTIKPDDLDQNIEFVNGVIKKINGNLKIENIVLNTGKVIDIDGLFILRNAISANTLLKDLKIENGIIDTNRNLETNIKGVYACGDCTGEPFQISKAVGEGLISALNCVKYIDNLKEV